MPIWVRCVLLLWVVRYVMMLFVRTHVRAHEDEVAMKVATYEVTKNYKKFPGYLLVYGATVVICRISIIPLAIWFIFLR